MTPDRKRQMHASVYAEGKEQNMNQTGNAYGTGPGEGIWPDAYIGRDDHEAAVAAAVQAERERIIRECVEPLMEALRRAGNVLASEWLERDAGDVDDALAAVERAMKEAPGK